MTVEEPHARVIGLETHHDIPARLHHDSVAADGDAREMRSIASIYASVNPGASEDLKRVAVEVKGVAAIVEIVQDDVDSVVISQDVCVGIDTVNDLVGGLGASAEGGVEGGDFLGQVSYIIEDRPTEGISITACALSERRGTCFDRRWL